MVVMNYVAAVKADTDRALNKRQSEYALALTDRFPDMPHPKRATKV